MSGDDNGARRPAIPFVEPSDSTRFMFQEYWVDFLGGLLPGTLFLAASLVALTPVFVVCFSIASLDFGATYFGMIADALETTRNTPNVIWFSLGTGFIVLSFVLGHLFYRQDPKLPNQKSFVRLRARDKASFIHEILADGQRTETGNPSKQEIDGYVSSNLGCAHFEDYLKKEYACTSEEDCQFPFPYFDQYLKNRGMNHLVPLVLWRTEPKYRSKNWINILKIRLKLHFPNRCSTIIRNEAHVRLASSTWYVGGAVCRCSRYGAFVLIGSAVLCGIVLLVMADLQVSQIDRGNLPEIVSNYTIAALFLLTVHYTGTFAMSRIEKFLHYQRQREVVHVLETSWAAFRERPDLLNPPFLAYLNPPFEFEE